MSATAVRRPMTDARRPVRNPARTVAVIPFANLTAEPTVDVFSDRVSEEIVAALGDFAGIVATSVPQPMLRSPDRHISHLRNSARGDVVLLGSVRLIEDGTAVAVFGSLFDAATGRQLWSGSSVASRFVDRSAVSAAARNVAAAIAGVLGIGRTPDDVYSARRDIEPVDRARTMWLDYERTGTR